MFARSSAGVSAAVHARRQCQCLVRRHLLWWEAQACYCCLSRPRSRVLQQVSNGASAITTRRLATTNTSFHRSETINGSVDGKEASSPFSENTEVASLVLENTNTTIGNDRSAPFEKEAVTTPLVTGVVLDHAVNLRTVRPGDRLDIPYELTISESLQDFWFACFFDQSRIHCSTPFCRRMGLQDRVLPFSLALFLTSSMSHADAAKVQGALVIVYFACDCIVLYPCMNVLMY